MGSHLCERLLSEGYRVVCIDNLRTGSLANIAHLLANNEPHFEYIDRDVTSHINLSGEVDEIYHFAYPASPKDFSRIPIDILKVGAVGTHNALGLARKRERASCSPLLVRSTVTPWSIPKGRTTGATSTL